MNYLNKKTYHVYTFHVNHIAVRFQGSYKTNNLSFDVDASFLPTGDYNLTGTLAYQGKSAGCLELMLTVA